MSAGTSKSVTVTYNNSELNCWEGNTYLPWNSNMEFSTNGSFYNQEYNVFWYKGKQVKLFDSEAQYYGYQVKVTRTSSTKCTYDNADANFWAIGTAGQLLNGENRGGVVTSTLFTAWVPTENSIQAVHMSPFFHFTSYDYTEDMPDGTTEFDSLCGEYEINCKYTVTYTGYKTVAAYTSAMSNIQAELETQTTELEEQTAEIKEQTKTQKGILTKITDFFGSFFQNLIDSVVGLFIPDKEDMVDLFERLNTFFANTFGFLYYPFDFIVDAFNIFLTADSDTGITFPGFTIMGYEVWKSMKYDIQSQTVVNTILNYVRMGTGAMLAMWFVNYLRNFFDKRFGGGGH